MHRPPSIWLQEDDAGNWGAEMNDAGPTRWICATVYLRDSANVAEFPAEKGQIVEIGKHQALDGTLSRVISYV